MIWLRNQRPEKSLTYAYERDKIGKMVKPDNSDLPKEFPLGGFLTKALVESDLTAVQQLFESDSGYFELVQGAPAGGAEAHSFYAQLPPDKTEDDKFVLGLFDETGKLTGVIDLIRDYPEPMLFGRLPSWGLYARHATGLQLRDISLRLLAPDARPAVALDDVSGLRVRDCDGLENA